MEVRTFDAITPDMIQGWKAKRGMHSLSHTKVLIAEDEKDSSKNVFAQFILGIPSQQAVLMLQSKTSNNEEFNKSLIANCVLGGDMDYLESDGQVYTAVLNECSNLLRSKPAETKKI